MPGWPCLLSELDQPKASLSGCESWRWRGLHACNLPAQIISPVLRTFLAGQIIWACRCSTALRPQAVQPARPPPVGSQQGRDGREPCSTVRRFIMATIGTFTADKDGFTGTLRTLTLNIKAKLVPNDKGDNEKAPDFRLQAAGHDIGAAWKKTSEAGREYISVTLDDPSFPATVYARLIEGEDGTHDLIWSRSKPQAA